MMSFKPYLHVDSKLPSDDDLVLYWTKHGYPYLGHHATGIGQWVDVDGGYIPDESVTHWMPIPTPTPVLKLSVEDQELFASTIQNPPELNDAMKSAFDSRIQFEG